MRKAMVIKLMHVAAYLRQLNNFHTLMLISTGLHMTPVSRLKKTWNSLKNSEIENEKKIYNEYSKIENLITPIQG